MLGFLEPVCRHVCTDAWYQYFGQYYWPQQLSSAGFSSEQLQALLMGARSVVENNPAAATAVGSAAMFAGSLYFGYRQRPARTVGHAPARIVAHAPVFPAMLTEEMTLGPYDLDRFVRGFLYVDRTEQIPAEHKTNLRDLNRQYFQQGPAAKKDAIKKILEDMPWLHLNSEKAEVSIHMKQQAGSWFVVAPPNVDGSADGYNAKEIEEYIRERLSLPGIADDISSSKAAQKVKA